MGFGSGLPAWIGEAEQHEGGSPMRGAVLQARSEGFNLERKVKTREMWLLVRWRGRGGRYFRGSRKFEIASAKKLARKVSSDTVPYSERAEDCSRRTNIFCDASHMVGYNKLCGIYLIFRLDLNYIMGSQLQRMVFELLEPLSVVNMQL
mgnify:CR=1 FL=1